MKRFFPILDWLPSYQRSHLSGDVFAGLTVGVMLIPQGMAYAMIAGLPPVYGLYASLVPQIMYAIFGTSRQLAVGPVAMDSLLVAAGVSVLAAAGSESYLILAVLLAFMMGAIQLLFGIARLGFLVNFLSQPVISGFTAAAAFIIGLNQLKHLIGVDLASDSIFSILAETVQSFDLIHWGSVAIGVGGIVLIKGLKKLHRSIPGALVAVSLGIGLVAGFRLDLAGIKILGSIPSGLPPFALPDLTNEYLTDLFPIALTLALIAFMEAISVSKAIHNRHRGEYEIDANQEMIALGMSNIVGSLFACYPTTGGFSRSAVNDQAGAKTNLAAIISAGLIALTLLFLTPLFFYLPKAILASIIMVAVFGLIDWKMPHYLWKMQRQDFFMFLVTFLTTLSLGIKEGIGMGVLLSLGFLIFRTTRPHLAVLGKLLASGEYRNKTRFQGIELREDILIVRYDAQLYFANIANFLDRVKQEVEKKGPELRLVILHSESINFIDTTALDQLKRLILELNEQGITFYFSYVIGPVRDFLTRTGFVQEMGKECFFTHIQEAVDYYDQKPETVQNIRFHVATQSNVFEERQI